MPNAIKLFSMETIDLSYVDNPKINSVNALKDHSDHKIFINGKSNEISLSGKWKFLFLNRFTTDVFSYLNLNFDINTLENFDVPKHFEFGGYLNPQYVNTQYPWDGREDVKLGHAPINNPLGIYFKDIDLSEGISKKFILRFEGFETALYLFINGEFVGYSEKNFVNSEFDITRYLIKGNNRIAVMVFKYSKGSWFLDQDMWRFGGLFRDVKLIIQPYTHIYDIDNKSILSEDNHTGFMDVNVALDGDPSFIKIIYRLSFDGNIIFQKETQAVQQKVFIKEKIENVKPWSAEEPNLYKLEISLIKNNEEIEYTSTLFGFKNLRIENGVMILNGKRLIIKGVNRHEFSAYDGRAISKELIEEDIKVLKANNCNAIRTSHYPNNSIFYDLCDKYGVYVIDEAPIETHGTWLMLDPFHKIKRKDVLPGDHEEFKEFIQDKVRSMYERDKNHTSILMWSLGNESYGGKVLKSCYEMLKKLDATRLVHYEGCFQDKKYLEISDVTSEMYTTPKNIEKRLNDYKYSKKPFILCEFEHAMGNSCGNFDEYMDLIEKYPSFQGGFIWDFVDQGIYDAETGIYKYGGDFFDRPNDGTFCCNGLFLASRESTPKVRTMKYAYQDLGFEKIGDKIRIINKNLFIDTSKYYFKVSVLEDGVVQSEDTFEINLLPGMAFDFDTSKIRIDTYKEVTIRISYHLKNDAPFAKKDDEMGFFDALMNFSYDKVRPLGAENSSDELKIIKTNYNLGVVGKDFSYLFNGFNDRTGGLVSLNIKGTEFIKDYPMLSLYRPNTMNENNIFKLFNSRYIGYSKIQAFLPLKSSIKVSKYDGKSIKIRYTYYNIDLPRIRKIKITYEVFNSGNIKVTANYRRHLFDPEFNQFGIKFTVPYLIDNFEYYGLGKDDTYPDRYKGVKLGVYNSSPKDEMINYVEPQECGNHTYTRFVKLRGNNGVLLGIYACQEALNVKCLPYSTEQIDAATHPDELPKMKYTFINICSKVRGCGGDDSWLDPVHKQYKLKKKGKYEVSFMFKKEN